MDAVSLSDVKSRFALLVQAAEAGQVVHISRHSKPVATLLFDQAYAALQQLEYSQVLGVAIDRWRRGVALVATSVGPWPPIHWRIRKVALWRDLAPCRTLKL